MIRLSILLCLLLTACTTSAGDTIIPIPNGDFEKGLDGWKIPASEKISSLSSDKAANGKYSLRIADHDKNHGSNVTGPRVAIPGSGYYQVRGKVFAVSGEGLGLYLHVFDKDGNTISPGEYHVFALGGSDKTWRNFEHQIYLPRKVAYIELQIHSYNAAIVDAYLDDLHIVRRDIATDAPPWKGQYKRKPHEQDSLTAADVVGPDGIVYPDWRHAGVQGGIPKVAAQARLENFGGIADDGKDDSVALQTACDSVGNLGGGAVILGSGNYHLDQPVTIKHSGVVIRGQGHPNTRLLFRFDIPAPGAAFYGIDDGKVGNNTILQLHCRPTDLMTMQIDCDGKTLASWTRSTHSGNTYSMSMHGREINQKLGQGTHTLIGTGTYRDGQLVSCKCLIDANPNYTESTPQSRTIDGVITFSGNGKSGPHIKLLQDGKRGDTTLNVSDSRNLTAGEYIALDAPATKRWKAITQNLCKWGTYRRNIYKIEAVVGNIVQINQPLRIDFPVIDGAYVQKTHLIERCGIEDLYIEQTANLWITTVMFKNASNCWGRGVKIKNCGRNPIYSNDAKWCEIRDCVFEDAWFKGGGGTAYTGWERSWDCLMENVETFRFRHAPLFQWAASGNVIRKSVFHDSDGQWHSGWTNENLMEQCVITSRRGHGAYGYGLWASPPEDTAHGPNGPRNVVYNCDITSERAGLWMGGMNENWLILHNRFCVDKGEGVFAKTSSFDHIIKGNVFILKDKLSPMTTLVTSDCIGVELIDNQIFGGNGTIASGDGTPAANQGNRSFPLREAARPTPDVPSIFKWQRENLN
ncbi:hypothetical protein CA13_49730 [Planctomycetes bacterium CA13]|uniref:Uncharacterized protein n=1 Tax=Novipirellula herctigrandis TaxID=2527986 RepID=A0A5C5Z8E9_9BACT|nr:hypothetical protein CA13_49730 [Planctomycetes bacterium CA13]